MGRGRGRNVKVTDMIEMQTALAKAPQGRLLNWHFSSRNSAYTGGYTVNQFDIRCIIQQPRDTHHH